MVTTRGKTEVSAYLRNLPTLIGERLLPGAARAGINVIKAEAEDRVASDDVRENLVTRVRRHDDKVTATLYVKAGWARSLANWLEYGTAPHVISVNPAKNGGRSARRLNELVKQGTLRINGKPVGATVYHPGADPHPFMRVSLDLRSKDAVIAAQSYIDARAARLNTLKDDE